MATNTIALIMAAGNGSRIPGNIPKQYIQLAGGPCALSHNITLFLSHNAIDRVQVVINPEDMERYKDLLAGIADQSKLLPPVFGGARRQDSVRLGLMALEALSPKMVLIHDAARPFIASQIIDRLIEKCQEAKAVIVATKVNDTVKLIPEKYIEGTLDRTSLYLAQTPQVFDYNVILTAHKEFKEINCTDDAELCEKAGIKIEFVEPGGLNFKITHKEDLLLAHSLMAGSYETRVGNGFDAHRFIDPVDKDTQAFIMLCGTKVKHDKCIDAHSDGDLVLHALTDAILGALGEADIGTHFPPSDQKWKNAESGQFVRYAHKLLKDRGGYIVNVDITIICEAPKIGPYRDAMKASLSEILDILEKRISVKATTTERMGFTGRKEGIAAQVVVSIKLPALY